MLKLTENTLFAHYRDVAKKMCRFYSTRREHAPCSMFFCSPLEDRHSMPLDIGVSRIMILSGRKRNAKRIKERKKLTTERHQIKKT